MADKDRKIPPKSKPPKLKVNGGPKNGKDEQPPIPATPVDEGIDENAPPKIRLGNANGHGETTKIELPPDALDKITPEDLAEAAKSETSRIDLSKARPPSDAKSDTSRLDLEAARPKQVEASGIDEHVDDAALAEASKKSTIRIDTPIDDSTPISDDADPSGVNLDATAKVDLSSLDMAQPDERIKDDVSEEELAEISKSSTIRIDAPIADAPQLEDDADPAVGAKDATAKVDINFDDQPPMDEGARRKELEEISKSSTIRIDAPVDDLDADAMDENAQEAAKSSTARVHVEEEPQKGDTARLDTDKLLQAEAAEASKKRTARIDMSEVLDADEKDIFKRRTALMDSSRLPGGDVEGPKTIRVRKSDTPPTTPLKKGPGGEERKSETSRIDMPEEAIAESGPPTKPKTIRIKRSDGSSASKQLAISRPPSGAVPVTSRITAADAEAPRGPGVAFTIITLAAVIVAALTLYILAAQTISPDLPWPGRLG